MARLGRDFGFWGSLGRMRVKHLFGPEFVGSVLIGGGGGYALLKVTELQDRLSVAGDMMVLIGALAGLVFAGFALVVGLLSDDYVRDLDEAEGGIRVFLAPFLFGVGVQIGALVLSVGYRAAAAHVSEWIESGSFVLLCFLFVFAALDVVALARAVLLHGVTRARSVRVRNLEDQARRSQDRRNPA